MNQPTEAARMVMQGKQKISASEAFVETLVSQGVTDVFGIVGSAYMDALDIFPAAGIRFIPVAHEQGAAHMADGYARVTGRQAASGKPETMSAGRALPRWASTSTS